MPDPAKSMAAFEGSWDLTRRQQTIDELLAMGRGMTPPPRSQTNEPHSVFMDVYAAFCRHHMATFGTTQRQMAAVSAKNHGHSVHNPRSQYRRSFSVDEVLAARPVVWPLTLPMCSPVSDGAAAALVCSRAFAEKLGALSRAVRIRASVLKSGDHRDPDRLDDHVARKASLRAYEVAGLGPKEIDVVECHDATAFGEILQSETLGFFNFGDGGPAAERGETGLGGSIPFNTSGGLEFERTSDWRDRPRPDLRTRKPAARAVCSASGRGRANRARRERRRTTRHRRGCCRGHHSGTPLTKRAGL